VLALAAHVAFFIWGGSKLIELEFAEPKEWVSEPVRLSAVDTAPEVISEPPPEEVLERPETDGELISEVDDILPELRDTPIEISPLEDDALPEMKIEKPALLGEDDGDLLKPVVGVDDAVDVPGLGDVPLLFAEVKPSQLIIDAGTSLEDVLDPDQFTEEFKKRKSAGGLAENVVLDGFTGLESYAKMAPGDLQRNKATIGSDLLFEFGRTTLRDDARLTLMTVAMLLDRNPNMYCWVEGHTDLIGDDRFNFNLSAQRGQAVKNWLVNALQLSPERIVVRAFGKTKPVVREGSIAEQALNRRVDIKMRKSLPEGIRLAPEPGRAIVVEEKIPRTIPAEDIPKAVPVEE
jgi:outer membrane protein OmpA-like peptidoglycan-associated protein